MFSSAVSIASKMLYMLFKAARARCFQSILLDILVNFNGMYLSI